MFEDNVEAQPSPSYWALKTSVVSVDSYLLVCWVVTVYETNFETIEQQNGTSIYYGIQTFFRLERMTGWFLRYCRWTWNSICGSCSKLYSGKRSRQNWSHSKNERNHSKFDATRWLDWARTWIRLGWYYHIAVYDRAQSFDWNIEEGFIGSCTLRHRNEGTLLSFCLSNHITQPFSALSLRFLFTQHSRTKVWRQSDAIVVHNHTN